MPHMLCNYLSFLNFKNGEIKQKYSQKDSFSFPRQINRAPSFATDQKIDYDVKKGALLNALKLLNIR